LQAAEQLKIRISDLEFRSSRPSYEGIALQLAEKVGVVLDFGWSGVILGGAAVHCCSKCIVLNPALAAEGTPLAHGRRFSQAV
jgi:hypothetical protein